MVRKQDIVPMKMKGGNKKDEENLIGGIDWDAIDDALSDGEDSTTETTDYKTMAKEGLTIIKPTYYQRGYKD